MDLAKKTYIQGDIHQNETETEIVEYRPGERLIDEKNGKRQPWRQKKVENLQYAEYLEILKFKKASRVHDCAETLGFAIDQNGEKKLYQVWFCKSRLCPMCQWRRSLKVTYELKQVLNTAIEEYPKAKFLFLTLTVKNCTGTELKSTLKKLTGAFHKLSKYKKVTKNLLGYVRSTEITVNETDESYHPHLHVLLMVKSTYFKTHDDYITQNEWTELWKRAAKLDYTPMVNIKKIYDKKGKGSLNSAALEVAKYQLKSKDYLNDDVDDETNLRHLKDLEEALAGTRQYGYGGVLKEIASRLKLPDEDDLVHIENEDKAKTEKVKMILAFFDYGRYDYFYKSFNRGGMNGKSGGSFEGG